MAVQLLNESYCAIGENAGVSRPSPRQIWGMWNSLAKRDTVQHKMFQNIVCSVPDVSWKFHEIPFTIFFS